ncbi:SMC-Scp complex subunit ScpB [Gulosibacter macacae]|uniref:SMC-Scp complex subunit ScpB n=1 Tax=Gulosibacter macacae TaxID=2488791 RepID=A0A3P3VUK1_9MICO|nr:SMC-Scp complex subunit ScpB [Gulosibacter macacae]RRJ85658.1 SMC-Scp complex subunit ScpB [Gulosibacter macacae]
MTDEQAIDATDHGEAPQVDLERALEAILFVTDEPIGVVALAAAVSHPVAQVRDAVARLVADYNGELGGVVRGFELREIGGGWRMYVRGDYDEIVGDYVSVRQPSKLSQAALETLTVIAYRQPITRSQIAQVRAVNVDSVVRTLLARGLVTETGHDATTGAALYATTELLLEHLGINSLDELPKISPLLDDGQDGFDD